MVKLNITYDKLHILYSIWHSSSQGSSYKLESTIQEPKDSVSSLAIVNTPVEDSLTAFFEQRHTEPLLQQQHITAHQQLALIPLPAETTSASCSPASPSDPKQDTTEHHRPVSDPEFLRPWTSSTAL